MTQDNPISPSPDLYRAAFDQLRFTMDDNANSARRVGSEAIALGRSAGYAALIGSDSAPRLWEKLEQLINKDLPAERPVKLPDIKDIYGQYDAEKAKTSGFANPENFPGTSGEAAFSRVLGSLAFALDYQNRGDKAFLYTDNEGREISGGDPIKTLQWGAAAARATGLELLAAQYERDAANINKPRQVG